MEALLLVTLASLVAPSLQVYARGLRVPSRQISEGFPCQRRTG
ncbi:hypothetical protein DEA8626_04081 [Defluviimonas aquaemixtae]|uniref:Uncharacterized protein n=1 Tax=Albidovulum aquaemixtae TaxID=1542388 RepID=A0A2R8BNP4_9RHOB|nr:hypothetical protein DEA8626_04081 [Defluviimonas aquaemixtae]